MLELVMLGTAASAPSIQRGLPSQVVLWRDERFLVDCGEGTQRQILRSGIGFRRLQRVLLTHGHLDHILGLGGLISTFARWEAVDRLEIYGGRWTLDRVEDLLFGVVLRGARPPVPIDLIDVRAGPLLENEDFEVVAFPVVHRGPGCFGYLFREKPRRPFLPEKAEALGVPAGPIRRDLVNGKAVTLADGRVIRPDDVLGPDRPGVSLALVGDIGQIDGLAENVRGADLLLCEATYLERDADLARRFGHLTAAQAARLAREAGVRKLALNHLSQRYRVREILDETAPIFGDVVVVRDFDHFTITRDKITLTNEEMQDDEALIEATEVPVMTLD
ncbi:MAG TPA: ribonuclease Z [Anaerolineae bacterium]|nr:ribonuclease Z [Anaerolineae bacterium]HQK14191.1 ribonuclease Z [Anaerolineae bacterium]